MSNEVLEGGLGGAAQGYAVGGPIGAVAGGIGGIIGGIGKKKARRKAEKRLREALAKLMAGSTDAFGNTLSADGSGRWSYNLGNAGRNAKSLAENAIREANSYQNRTNRQVADDNALINALAEIRANNAAKSAVSQAGIRTGSNLANALGNIARQSTKALKNSWINGLTAGKNANQYNASMRSALINNATNGMTPINSMQKNLQSMVQGLNIPTAKMSLGVASSINGLNGISADPEYNKKNNALSLGLSSLF